MKFIKISILVFLSSAMLTAQEGFIHTYDFEELDISFHEILLVEDTLVICGQVLKEDRQQVGILFAKMDTLGNLLSYQTHYDSLGDSFLFERDRNMIKTKDGGYALVGKLFFKNSPMIMKLDVNGHLEFVKDFPDSTVYNIRHRKIIEIQSGFISVGSKQQKRDFKCDAFIMKTDRQGNQIWEIEYGKTDLYDHFREIYQMNENELLLLGSSFTGTSHLPSYYDASGTTLAIKIDTLGEILWEWESEVQFLDGSRSSPQQIFFDTDSTFIYPGVFNKVIFDDEIVRQGEIVKCDTNFNIIWTAPFGDFTLNQNTLIDITPVADGGSVAVGQYYSPGLPFEEEHTGHFSGWITKVDQDGTPLWELSDTLRFNLPEGSTYSQNYLSSVIALPSGSVIACGHLQYYMPTHTDSYSLLVKVDPHGCIDTYCNFISSTNSPLTLIKDIQVFPNPTHSDVTIKGEGVFNLKISDVLGNIITTQKDIYSSTSFDLSPYPKGIYFFIIEQENSILTKKVIRQ